MLPVKHWIFHNKVSEKNKKIMPSALNPNPALLTQTARLLRTGSLYFWTKLIQHLSNYLKTGIYIFFVGKCWIF
jgi:hypothetical protein